MDRMRCWVKTGMLLLLVCLVVGCAKANIRYEPNVSLYKVPRYEKTLVVRELKDVRPEMENRYFNLNATSDIRCTGDVVKGLGLVIKNDLAKSGLFKEVVLQPSVGEAPPADVVLEGEIRHLYGRYQEKWMKFPAAFGLLIAAPYFIPYEQADFNLELHLRVLDAKDQTVLWERTLQRRWTYGPMTAFEFSNHYALLYERLCHRLKNQMGAGIKDLDITLASRWHGAAL